MKSNRLKFTTSPEAPATDRTEGYRAAWWRERILGYSRPQLAQALDLVASTILRYEGMDTVPREYSLACAALHVDRLNRVPSFKEGRFIWPTE